MELDYWLFSGKNGLKGVASTTRIDPDGRVVVVKDPDNPAVLKDDDIAYCLRTSRQARDEFTQIFPSLLPEEQARLTELIQMNPRATALLRNEQDFADAVQHADVTADVRPRLPEETRPSQIAAIERIKEQGGGT